MVWTEGEDNLQTFLHHLNSIHPTITFAHEYSNSSHQSLPFLYVQDHLDNSLIETDPYENFLDLMKLHTKPTDKRHPALHILCFFLLNTATTFLKKNRVRFIPRQETLKPQPQNNNSNQTPFVITYVPALSNFSTTVRKNVNILQSSNRCKQIFPSPPIVAYKRSPNLRDLLVRSTLRDCTWHTTRKTISQRRFKMQSSTLLYLSIFKTGPSQLHLHLHKRETTYIWPLKQ